MVKKELEKLGFKVYVPKFPTPENQNLENWLKVFEKYLNIVDENTIFIGHSLGCAFILNVLERIDKKVKACFLVSGFIGKLGIEQFDKINKTFTEKHFDWDKIRRNCEKFILFHSDNDPYVPLEKAYELKEKLNGELVIIKGAGHFNIKSGYNKFPELLNKILEIINF